jgi:hypothetical protein
LFVETMMDCPRCPDHGRKVLDLALGRLDDEDGVRAEKILRSCDVCSGWWQAHLEGDAASVVDSAVGEAWAGFSAPRRRRLRPWLAAAAAVVFALTVYWAQDLGRGSHQPPAVVAEAGPEGEPGQRADLRWTAVPRDLPASAEVAPAGLSAEAVETDRVLGAVFGGEGSAADAGSLARILAAPRRRDS